MAAALLGRVRDVIAGLRSGPPPPALSPDELPAGRERRRRPRTNVAEAQTPLPLIRIMDRYVLRTFLNYLAILVATFVLIWCVFSFFELLSDMLARQKLGLFIPYIYYLTPFLIYETTPLGVLVATLVCFGILAKHHELTAFKACGVSLYRLAAPILAVSFLLSGLLFSLDYYYLPETNRRQDAIRDEIKGRPVSTYLRPDRQWTAGQGDRIFYHLYFDSANKVLAGINLYDFDPKTFQLRRHISAERARWDEVRSIWVFENGWVRGIEDARVPVYYETFTARSFPDLQEDPAYFMKEDRQHQQMNWEELRAYILDLTQSGFDTIRLQVQLHKKLAFPLFAFVMAVLAVPFSLLAGHRGALTGVVLGIALAIAYYALNALFEQMGRANQLTPAIAAWSPSLIFGLSGAYLFVRVRS
jgi:LPS export ABC transporter permease LptG